MSWRKFGKSSGLSYVSDSVPVKVPEVKDEEDQTVMIEYPELLLPYQVAKLFSVDPKTVTRWAKSGKLAAIKTPGGHRRYRESDVRALLEAGE